MAYLSDFRPLFRLLDDYETHRSRPAPSRVTPSQFTPAFDVRELNDAYYLDGELPGVDQSNIEIEFIDPQTLVIKGHTERSYQDNKNKNKNKPRWHQPTVQDDEDDSTETPAAAAATSLTTSDKAQAQSDSFHYWASERSVGEFQRTFTFPTRVDQDGVRASLKNGILSVVVPKQSAPKTKKIRIQ